MCNVMTSQLIHYFSFNRWYFELNMFNCIKIFWIWYLQLNWQIFEILKIVCGNKIWSPLRGRKCLSVG